MTTIEKIIVGILTIIIISGAIFLSTRPQTVPVTVSTPIGSVVQGNEYHSTTTRSINVGAVVQNLSVLQLGPGSLGSVIITGAAAGTITLYDATSTVNNASYASTTIVTFPNSTAAGTYTIDALFYKGLLLEYTGTLGTSTITWRGN